MIASGIAHAQALPKKGGNPMLKAIKGKILSQQAAKTAAKGAAGTDERLIGASLYQGDIVTDSTRYIYSGTRYSDVTNIDFNSYQDNFDPSSSIMPLELGDAVHNRLAYDTMYHYSMPGSGSSLVLDIILSKAYDTDNRAVMMNFQGFDAGLPAMQQRYYITYAGTGTDIGQAVLLNDTSELFTGMFDTAQVFTVQYNAGAQREQDSLYQAGAAGYNLTTYTYTTEGLISSVLFSTSPDGVTYVPQNRSSYTYDESNRLVRDLEEVYADTEWQPSYLDSFSYTGTSPLYTHNISYAYTAGDWTPDYQFDAVLHTGFTAYDTAFVLQDWGEGILEPTLMLTFKYNTNEHLTNMYFYFADGEGGYMEDPIIDLRYFYGPIVPVSVPEVAVSAPAVKLYPNPATSHIFVEAAGKVNVSVYNLSGQLLLQQSSAAQNGGVQLNIANLPAGTYVADVQTEKGNSKVKFVKQ